MQRVGFRTEWEALGKHSKPEGVAFFLEQQLGGADAVPGNGPRSEAGRGVPAAALTSSSRRTGTKDEESDGRVQSMEWAEKKGMPKSLAQ